MFLVQTLHHRSFRHEVYSLAYPFFPGALEAFAGTNKTCSPNPSSPICMDIMLAINVTAENTVLPAFSDTPSHMVAYEFLAYINYSSTARDTVSGFFNISATIANPPLKLKGAKVRFRCFNMGLPTRRHL